MSRDIINATTKVDIKNIAAARSHSKNHQAGAADTKLAKTAESLSLCVKGCLFSLVYEAMSLLTLSKTKKEKQR